MKKLFIVLCIVLSAAGCGKRGRLDVPPNAAYPRQYPAPRNPAAAKQSAPKQEPQAPSSILDLNKTLAEQAE